MNRIEQHLSRKLDERSLEGNLRRLSVQRAPVDFYSNDYLGLVTEGKLSAWMQSMPGHDEPGSTGSRLLSGNSAFAEELESFIASFHKAGAALLFNSGYNANVGLLSCLPDRNTTILYDESCHASLLDGIRLSLCARKFRFAHNDLNDLEDKLNKNAASGPVLVVVESVYSMDGDTAPLVAICALCENRDAQLVVDEAHATGVIGNHGEGMVCSLGLEDRVFARIHTFGKALGCHGAAVVGSALLRRYLVNFARTFIYTTALPPHALKAAWCAYRHLADPGFTNTPLHKLVHYFTAQVKNYGLTGWKYSQSPIQGQTGWKDSQSPIQALVMGSNESCRQAALRINHAGLQVNPILYPTVPLGMERLRVCLHSFNTREQVDMLLANC